MPKFPVDAPKRRILKTLEILGFATIREREHISPQKTNPDGSKTALAMPNHPTLRATTLRTICGQVGISRDDFLEAFEKTRGRSGLMGQYRPLYSARISE